MDHNIPIPINKVKIDKLKWLNKSVKYDNKLYIRDLISQMAENTYNWILSKDDLECISDFHTFELQFINLIYDKYLNEQ